jgi:NAD(P)-dependent dehydrogenase (short-subunit alcohol dehydrogenase family)
MTTPKSIFVTGAASGIGRETALFFADKGWTVGIFDVNESGLTSLGEQIGEDRCIRMRMDVTDFDSVKSAVSAFTDKTGGRMDILFNNAGILRMGTLETIPLADQGLTIDINLKGMLNCIYAALDVLKQTEDARIINMSSGSAAYGIPDLAVYSATKHAVRGLTEALNIEFEPFDIYVCDIMPGYVATPMVTDAAVQAKSVEKLGVNITTDEIAQLVWKAAHNKKIHWPLGGSLVVSLILTLLPFLKRPMIKSSTGY